MAPDLIRQVLLDEADSVEKGELSRRVLGPALGDAILTADGSRWSWQRRAVAPIFRQERIQSFLPAMLAAAERTRDRWCSSAAGTEIDIAREMMMTTFDVNLTPSCRGGAVSIAILVQRSNTHYLEPVSWIAALASIRAPNWVPYPGLRKARRAREHLHDILRSLIIESKQQSDFLCCL